MVSLVALSLMVVSNAASWYTVVKSSGSVEELRSGVWKIALFYASWALYNRYPLGRTKELGHFSFGTLFAACLAPTATTTATMMTVLPLVFANLLVTANFALVIPMIVSAGGPVAFALKIWKKGDDSRAVVSLWGYVFTAYMVSNTVLWAWSAYLSATLP